MTEEIFEKLAELVVAASDICSELWRISEDESLTAEEKSQVESCALDADQLATNIKQL